MSDDDDDDEEDESEEEEEEDDEDGDAGGFEYDGDISDAALEGAGAKNGVRWRLPSLVRRGAGASHGLPSRRAGAPLPNAS